ncbi:MAG: TlpA disulfide reductase family protein [Bacteroidota bacterium]
MKQKNKSNSLLNSIFSDFEFLKIDSSKSYLFDYKAKKTLLCFWSPTCGLCQDELPTLSKLQQIYIYKGLKIIAYSIDTNVNEIKKQITDSTNNLIFCWNSAPKTLDLIVKYNIYKIPFFILLDKNKKIIEIIDNKEKLLEVLNKTM